MFYLRSLPPHQPPLSLGLSSPAEMLLRSFMKYCTLQAIASTAKDQQHQQSTVHVGMMTSRHPPHEILVKMQPIVSATAPETNNCSTSSSTEGGTSQTNAHVPTTEQATRPPPTVEKVKADIEKINKNFPRVPPGEDIQTLSDAEFKRLVMATNSYDKERVFGLITTLQAQLKEHHTLIDRLEKSETERKKLFERNSALEKENTEQEKLIQEQDERLHSLEGEVISLKLDLANEKGLSDHVNLSVHQLTSRNSALENENQDLKHRLSASAESGEAMLIRTDFKHNSSSRATKNLLFGGKGRRSSLPGELASSIRTNFTEASTASGSSQVSASERFLSHSITKLNRNMGNVPSTGTLAELTEESSGFDRPVERNLVSMTRSWVSERVIRPNNENKFGYY